MEKYKLITAWDEQLHTLIACSKEEATEMFAMVKNLPVDVIKKLFLVKKVKISVDRNPVETSFEKWACDLKQE